jgi:hypothetical protein
MSVRYLDKLFKPGAVALIGATRHGPTFCAWSVPIASAFRQLRLASHVGHPVGVAMVVDRVCPHSPTPVKTGKQGE